MQYVVHLLSAINLHGLVCCTWRRRKWLDWQQWQLSLQIIILQTTEYSNFTDTQK